MEKLFFNGDIITMEGEHDFPEAVLIADGKIKAVGAYDAVDAQKSADAQLVDLKGKTLMPSFIDGHGHISMAGTYIMKADLTDAKNFDDIIRILRQFQQEHDLTHGEHILGYAYDHNFLEEGRHPDKTVLDQVSTEFPVMISHTSGHMGVVNSKMLELAGITADSPEIEGGLIDRYPGTTEPTGYLEESALMTITVPNPQKIDAMQLLIDVQQEYLKNGVTTVQDGGSAAEGLKMFLAADAAGKLDVDIEAYPFLQKLDMLGSQSNDVSAFQSCMHKFDGHVKINGYKILLDGSPQGRTAWMSEPYVAFEGDDPNYCGYPWNQAEDVHTWVKQALDDNMQLLTHCNGDAASQQLLDIYEDELAKSANPNKDKLRPVMIHCQTVRDDQLDRMAKIQMIPSIFVGHVNYWGDIHLKNFGDRRGRRVSPVKSALDRGLIYNFHTDTPVVKPKMLHAVWTAVNRITRYGVECGPEQRVGVYDALKGITINPAYCYFEEDSKGSIKVGKRADLVILEQNPLKIDPMAIKDIQVLETIKDGKTVYHA